VNTEKTNIPGTFPDQWKAEFEGLAYLGYLSKEVTSIPFHHFVVRTLKTNEKLEITLLTKEYSDTLGYGRAYKAAVVAAALESIDGRQLVPVEKGTNTLRQKFEYVINSWYDPVIDILYREVDELEGRVIEVLIGLGIIKVESSIEPIFKDEQEESDDPKVGK